jgi:hypothetical protein
MIHTERPPCQLNFQTLYCIQLFSGRDGGKRNGVDEQRNYQKEGHHAAGWGVSKFLSLSARERAEQSPGIHSTVDDLGAQCAVLSIQSLVRLQMHLLLP